VDADGAWSSHIHGQIRQLPRNCNSNYGLGEDIVLDTRPNQDEVRFSVEMQRLSPVADGKCWYVQYDSYSHPRFHVLAPTVHDSAGKQGKATLELTTTQAVIDVDPGQRHHQPPWSGSALHVQRHGRPVPQPGPDQRHHPW